MSPFNTLNAEHSLAAGLMSPAQATTLQDEIHLLKARLAKAQSDTHTRQLAEDRERYLAAYDDAEALELQLKEKIGQSGVATADSLHRANLPDATHHEGSQ
ncbi:MAG: hypothetical protein ABI671_20605 [Burkholderiales bacterium]